MEYSVLMSVYHKEDSENFKAAIESMLSQTVPPDDFVIVCDGPLTESLDAVIDSFISEYGNLFTIVRLEKCGGLGMALHRGISECRCEAVARMDSDDISVPDRMEKELEALKKHPEISVVGGQISEFSGSADNVVGIRKVPLCHEDIITMMKGRNPINHVTAVFRKSHVLDAGNYSDFQGFEDYCLWSELYAKGRKFMNIDKTCCLVRVNSDTYRRRGGKEYFRQTVRMENVLLKSGLINRLEYIINISVRFAGTTLLPNNIRGFLFRKLLRQKHE